LSVADERLRPGWDLSTPGLREAGMRATMAAPAVPDPPLPWRLIDLNHRKNHDRTPHSRSRAPRP